MSSEQVNWDVEIEELLYERDTLVNEARGLHDYIEEAKEKQTKTLVEHQQVTVRLKMAIEERTRQRTIEYQSALQNCIDEHGVWPSEEAKKSRSYEACVMHMARIINRYLLSDDRPHIFLNMNRENEMENSNDE